MQINVQGGRGGMGGGRGGGLGKEWRKLKAEGVKGKYLETTKREGEV